jgi:Lrp/AsnC family transcriptional regulator, regulator for asnA, asnC and gidA
LAEAKLNTAVDIDEIDDKILHILIQDARTSLKDIAKDCGISPVSVLNRITRLKKLGVITGATLFPALNILEFQIVATIGMETDSDTDEIVKFFKEHTYLIEPSTSIGEYDLCTLVYAENITKLNEQTDAVRIRFGIRKVIVNVWSNIPHMTFENIDLNPTKKG